VFHLDLVRPAATAWDLRILERLWRALERYVRVGYARIDGDAGPGSVRGWDDRAQRSLIAAYRSGDPETVRRATLDNIDAYEQIAQRGLE
jgi:DNA-binding GntR family transcriptional regulator